MLKLAFLAGKVCLMCYPLALVLMEQVSDITIADDYFKLATGGSFAGGGIATGIEIYRKIPARFKALEKDMKENRKAIEDNNTADSKTQAILEGVEKNLDKVEKLVHKLMEK